MASESDPSDTIDSIDTIPVSPLSSRSLRLGRWHGLIENTGSVMSRTVSEELLHYINAAHVECVRIISSDHKQFDVPSVFLCARSKTLELMISRMKNGEWKEGEVKALSLPEDGELIEAFLTAIRCDSVPWIKFLKCELTRPGAVAATIKHQKSEYFSPLIQSPLGAPESVPVPFKQVLLGRILDLLGMAHKYEFEVIRRPRHDSMHPLFVCLLFPLLNLRRWSIP
eukprot:Protomagalhaensia_sp_Gyna_25__4951@NODE_535_length_3184_cov_84_221622_g419_i0_p2_GENE_NODE_535_length_3184_cov_84_221622_g419_i0NODE_535_length_3184_cov_84_221622_g419_i0_p2_ORF_typecomplete_len240_score27_90BTB/PF00651_31/0_0073Skp1_POZ/PF03931_15/3_1e03Skp1_POZ/PF03931_15/0_014_NODE_535_length_3184_cov_84_221622_g419_i024633140